MWSGGTCSVNAELVGQSMSGEQGGAGICQRAMGEERGRHSEFRSHGRDSPHTVILTTYLPIDPVWFVLGGDVYNRWHKLWT